MNYIWLLSLWLVWCQFLEKSSLCAGTGAGVSGTLPHMVLLKGVLGNSWDCSVEQEDTSSVSSVTSICREDRGPVFNCARAFSVFHMYRVCATHPHKINQQIRWKTAIKRVSYKCAPGCLSIVNNWPSRLSASHCYRWTIVGISVVHTACFRSVVQGSGQNWQHSCKWMSCLRRVSRKNDGVIQNSSTTLQYHLKVIAWERKV